LLHDQTKCPTYTAAAALATEKQPTNDNANGGLSILSQATTVSDKQQDKQQGGSGGMSIGLGPIVGIVVACVAAILLVVGVSSRFQKRGGRPILKQNSIVFDVSKSFDQNADNAGGSRGNMALTGGMMYGNARGHVVLDETEGDLEAAVASRNSGPPLHVSAVAAMEEGRESSITSLANHHTPTNAFSSQDSSKSLTAYV
jgi:hypothetical protein